MSRRPLFFTLAALLLVGCTSESSQSENYELIKPGGNIGEMTVEQSTEIPYQSIWWFCDSMPDTYEPTSTTSECEVPLVTRLDIHVGWLAKESKMISNWDALTYEVYLDDHNVDLDNFEWFETDYTAKGEHNKSRDWILTVKDLTPGTHNLRYLWRSDVAVDDGFNVYQPGTYESVVNFTVLEKAVYPKFSAKANIGQHPFTSQKSQLDFLLYLPDEYGKDPLREWPLLVYLHDAPLRGATLELLMAEPFPKIVGKENDFPFIVVSPLGDGGYEFWAKDEMIDPLFTLLEEIQTAYNVNAKKIFLTGNGMGGEGVWVIGLRYPEYFTALAPVAGYFGWPPEIPENICDLIDVPVWAFHGGRDDIIPVESGQELVDALNACGGNAQITISSGMKIDVPYKVYADPELYQWLTLQSKK